MSKDLLTELLDSVTAVHAFISTDLAREALSPDCSYKREKFSQILNDLCNRIRSVPPSLRPLVNTPSNNKAPKPPPPPPTDIPEIGEEEEQEMYTDMEGVGQLEEVTDYLEFEPSQRSGGDLSQEMYEAMAGEQDDDVYEEPIPGPPVQEPVPELYEEPSLSSDSRPSTASSLQPPTPSQSRENSASGAEFIESTRERAQMERSGDVSTDWNGIYSPPKKGSGDSKVGSLKGISIKGILEKLGGHNRKNWQKRYCVMSGPLMYFYEKESSKSYNNFICVLNFTVSKESTLTNEKKKQFAFKLTQTDTATGTKKDYCFRAISSETREKWIASIEKVTQKIPPPSIFSSSASGMGSSVTLPRMPSSGHVSPIPTSIPKPRSFTTVQDLGDNEDLYEDVPAPIIEEESEEEDGGDYLPVSPAAHGDVEELTSSAEYVDVAPGEEILEETYEDTTAFHPDAPPPPPMTPPPGPPTSHPLLPPRAPQEVAPPTQKPALPPHMPAPPTHKPALPPHTPAPPTQKPAPPPPLVEDLPIDLDKMYSQGSNGIVLKKVYVSLWDFEAHEKDELGLIRGDLILVSEPSDGSDWWFGELLDIEATKKIGKRGLFPRQYADLAFEGMAS